MSDNASQDRQVPAATPQPAPDGTQRIREAIAVLKPLAGPALAEVVWSRMCDGRDSYRLRGIGRDEGPADIFIDIVRYNENSDLSLRLREAVAFLLSREAAAQASRKARAVAELCLLAAGMGARQAILPLTVLAEREERVKTKLGGNETLYERALDCLGGLLAELPGDLRAKYLLEPRHRDLFSRALHFPGFELTALTLLIGLWDRSEQEFRNQLPTSYRVDEPALAARLAIAFDRKTDAAAR